MSRTSDTSAAGVVTLESATSGATVTNVQRELNSLSSYTGKALNSASGVIPAWTDNQVGASTNSLFSRTDALTVKFNSSTGHRHTGAAGDAPAISANDLADFNPYTQAIQLTQISGYASASSVVVTSAFTGKSPFGTAVNAGVLTVRSGFSTRDASNMVRLRIGRDPILDDNGKEVFGYLIYDTGTEAWTLETWKTDPLGDVGYPIASDDPIKIYYREVFQGSLRPTLSPLLEVDLFGSGSGSGGGGTVVSDNFTGTTLTLGAQTAQKWRYTGGSAQTLATLDISALDDDEYIEILGTSDTNTISISPSVSNIAAMNGTWVGYFGSVIVFRNDSGLGGLVEVSRNGL